MKTKSIVFISVVLLVVALAVGVVWTWLDGSKPQAASPGSTSAVMPQTGIAASSLPAPSTARIPDQPAGDNSQPAPWAGSNTAAALQPSVVAAAKLTADERVQRIKELEKMQIELAKSMGPGMTPDPRQVDAALAKIQQITGNSYAGINLDAVRNNLAKAQEMQAVALQIDLEAKKPGGGDAKQMRVYLEQLQKLQSQLRLDVTANATVNTVKPK